MDSIGGRAVIPVNHHRRRRRYTGIQPIVEDEQMPTTTRQNSGVLLGDSTSRVHMAVGDAPVNN